MTENIEEMSITTRFIKAANALVGHGLLVPTFALKADNEELEEPATPAECEAVGGTWNAETERCILPAPKEKAQSKDSFDLAVEQHFQKGFNEFVKAREAKPAPKDAFDAAVKKKLDSL